MAVGDTVRAPAVRRAVAVLDVIAHAGQASAAEISHDLMLPKSSTANLVATMHEEGFLARRGDDYIFGELITELTAGFTGDPGVLERFATYWGGLPLLHEHTISVHAILGTRALCLDMRLGKLVLPTTPRTGRVTELWAPQQKLPLLQLVPRTALMRTLARFEGFSHSTEVSGEVLDWWDDNGGLHPVVIHETERGSLSVGVFVPATSPVAPPLTLTAHLLHSHSDEVGEVSQALTEFAARIATPPTPAD
ncbi:MAG: helix-turn-helix domain-containing protein [Leucobacter sp.]